MSTHPPARAQTRHSANLVALGLLLLLFASLTFGARQLSLTYDEPSHLTSGYTALARGQAGLWTILARGHPLLVDAWEALPLFLSRPDISVQTLPGWKTNYTEYVASFLAYLEPLERTAVAGRTPAMLLAMLLAATVYRWAKDLSGKRAALFALGVLVLDPLLVAHGRLATNDVGVVAFGTLALYAGWRWWQRPRWINALSTGVLFTAALLSKQSGAIWAAAFGLGTLLIGLIERRSVHFWAQAVVIGWVAFVLLWASYGFTIGNIPKLPFPVPAPLHWSGLLQSGEGGGERGTFVIGMRQVGNWIGYFPVAFLVKNPLPFLMGLGIGIVTLARRHLWPNRVFTLALFPLVYTMIALKIGLNIGYRHLLPIHPFLYLLIGGGLSQWARTGGNWRRWVLGGLIAWQIVGAVLIFPNEITFFNELAGGPSEGYRYLVDSNVDWGQSFKQLQGWLASHPGDKPRIAYFNFVSPAQYGIEFTPLRPIADGEPLSPQYRPAPGRYVVAATILQGMIGRRSDLYEWFRHVEPTAQVGNALFVYDIDPFDGRWLAQCSTPAEPLTDEAIQDGIGRAGLRSVLFDCTQAWIYPHGGQTPGWYALHGRLYAPNGLKQRLLYSAPTPQDPFLSRHLNGARFSFQQETISTLPPFVLYEATRPPTLPRINPVWAAGAETAPSKLAGTTTLSVPQALDGPLTLVGVASSQDKEGWQVETWWQVTAPITRPLSIMAHLITQQGDTLTVADGLGIDPQALEAGDVIVQRHRFPASPQGQPAWLRTGAYWLDVEENARWTVADAPGADALFVRLEDK